MAKPTGMAKVAGQRIRPPALLLYSPVTSVFQK